MPGVTVSNISRFPYGSCEIRGFPYEGAIKQRRCNLQEAVEVHAVAHWSAGVI